MSGNAMIALLYGLAFAAGGALAVDLAVSIVCDAITAPAKPSRRKLAAGALLVVFISSAGLGLIGLGIALIWSAVRGG